MITEVELREQLPIPEYGATVYVDGGVRLTPAASEFISTWKLMVLDSTSHATLFNKGQAVEQAAKRPAGKYLRKVEVGRAASRTTGVSPSSPVQPVHSSPVQPGKSEPVHGGVSVTTQPLTKLNERTWVSKTDGRIKLRGQVEAAQATVLMAHAVSISEESPLQILLAELADYIQTLHAALFSDEDIPPYLLNGKVPQHLPTNGGLNSTVVVNDQAKRGLTIHWLNIARTQLRALEIQALETYGQDSVRGLAVLESCNSIGKGIAIMQNLDFSR